MKLKERLVAAIAGFSLAILLIASLETFEVLTTHPRGGAEGEGPSAPPHGVIKSNKAQRNLQKTDSSGLSDQQVDEQGQKVQWKSGPTTETKASKVLQGDILDMAPS